MRRVIRFIILGIIVSPLYISAQVNYTANDKVVNFGENDNEFFLYGSNCAWKNDYWPDEIMGTILCSDPTEYGNEGPNVNSLRPALYDRFVDKHGVEFRIPTFEHYASKGAKVNTIFLSGPRDAYKNRTCALTSEEQNLPYDLPASFKNIYEPIWIEKDGKKTVNPNNYYAQYVYNVSQNFKKYTRFWEVWNEPDLTYKGNGDKVSGTEGNWWDKDPDPCELHNLRSPIQHYVRLLRISYEVIKSVDENAVICTGGLGYSSFLDAILRNTDNPDAGKVTNDYPKKGGAYFDYVSFHVYPMYYLREWVGKDSQHPDGFSYFRHSDAATDAAINHQTKMKEVLVKHGYDGISYPEKGWILSETNVPSRKVKGNDQNGKKWFIGSDEAQRNYLTKIAITCQKNNIDAIYVYCPYDNDKGGNEGEYDVMGFYRPLQDRPGAKLNLKPGGKAWRTMVRLLADRKYDATETEKLGVTNIEWKDKVEGGAFYSRQTNDYIYVLWAKTSKDDNETASVKYKFLESMSVTSSVHTDWNGVSITNEGDEITLSGSPVFVRVSSGTANIPVTEINIDKPELLEMSVGDSIIVSYYITPPNATNKDVNWICDNHNILSIDPATGLIKTFSTGTAKITIQSENYNVSATFTIIVKNDISSNDNLNNSSLKLYPNPIKNILNIEGTKKGDLIEIYSLNGILIYTHIAQEGMTIIPFANYKKGIYTIIINGEARKIIKNNRN